MLGALVQKAAISPLVRNTAVLIIGSAGCDSRDDACELQAVFDAVKSGDPAVAPFKSGLKYVADPRFADYFESPVDTINQCLKGACASDCDGHAGLIAALLASLGWKVGLRAYGVLGSGGYSHVYAVAAYPKKPVGDPGAVHWNRAVGLDTTVPSASVGWEPPRGEVLTAWLD
jgi:hypothetical protein